MNKDCFSRFCAYLSLFVSVSLSCLWCWNTGSFKVVNLDTFVGVIVALLAILITIVLGWQIYNAIELKQKINELDQLKNHFMKQQESIQQLTYKTAHGIHLIWGSEAVKEKHYPEAFRYYIFSLKNTLLLSDEKLNLSPIHQYMTFISKQITKGMNLEQKAYSDVVNTDKEIRSMHDYPFIKEWYEPVYKKFIECVNK